MPCEILHDLSKSGVDVYETDNIPDVLDKTDVLYLTFIIFKNINSTF